MPYTCTYSHKRIPILCTDNNVITHCIGVMFVHVTFIKVLRDELLANPLKHIMTLLGMSLMGKLKHTTTALDPPNLSFNFHFTLYTIRRFVGSLQTPLGLCIIRLTRLHLKKNWLLNNFTHKVAFTNFQ